MSEEVRIGDRIRIHYVGTFENGEEFDSTAAHGGDPLEFIVGAHQVIPGVENGVIGMKEKETKEIQIPPEEGYGPRFEQLMQEVPLSALPQGIEIKEGLVLAAQTMDGHQIPATVVKVTDTHAVMDLNHPLAGKVLNFKITLEKIVERDIDVEQYHHHHDHPHSHGAESGEKLVDVDMDEGDLDLDL